MHSSSKLLSEDYSFIADDERVQAVDTAIHEAKPRIVLHGHIPGILTQYYRYGYGTVYIRIDNP